MTRYDSLKHAQKINLSRQDFQGGGALKPNDDYDLYRVKLRNRSSFSLSLESKGKKANADVELYGLKGSHRSAVKAIGRVEFGGLKRRDIRQHLQRLSRSKKKGLAPDAIEADLEKGTYYIRVYQKKNHGKYTLTMSGSGDPSLGIDLQSPNGGENLITGNTYSILWESVSDTGTVNVGLYQGQSLVHNIQTSTPNDGRLDWMVPTTLNPGTNYTLKLELNLSTKNGAAVAVSDRAFHISHAEDWFDQNMRTKDLQNLARSSFSDRALDRSDMLNLFDSVAADGKVEAKELSDLQTVVAHHQELGIADHVRVLSDKVINDNSANSFYQGSELGNLAVGSSGEHLNVLVDKWFMGGDRPSTPDGFSMTYAQANGSLFGTDNEIQLTDIRQGYLGDCYFLAALGANVVQQPDMIRNMFIDNGDGTFTVKFYGQNNGKVISDADYVTVDRWLPTNVSDGQYSGQSFAAFDANDRGLWVALAEKAYAQFAESSLSFRPVPINSYEGINYGKGFRAMAAISGKDGNLHTNLLYGTAQVGGFPNFNTIDGLFSSKTPVVASTITTPGLGIVSDHQYIITSTNAANQTITLYNPQGERSTPQPGETAQGFRTLSYADFAANFDTVEFQQA